MLIAFNGGVTAYKRVLTLMNDYSFVFLQCVNGWMIIIDRSVNADQYLCTINFF